MKLAILIIVSIFLGIVIYTISLFIRVSIRVNESSYGLYIDYLKRFLLSIEEDIIDKKGNPSNNTVLLEAKTKSKVLPDKILILFFGNPGVDKDGDIFIVISKTNWNDKQTIKVVSDILFVTDSRDNFEYFEYSKDNLKRIKRLVNFINKNRCMNIYWSTNSDVDLFYSRKQIIEVVKGE